MVKDSRHKMFIRKEPELITLDSSDDEAMDEDGVVIVDEIDITSKGQNSVVEVSTELDADSIADSFDIQSPSKKPPSPSVRSSDSLKDSHCLGKGDAVVNLVDFDVNIDPVKELESLPKTPSSNSNSNSSHVTKCSQICEVKNTVTPIECLVNSDVIVVDSVKKKPPFKSPPSKIDTGDILKDSNRKVKKRKVLKKNRKVRKKKRKVLKQKRQVLKKKRKVFEKKNARDDEIVEILDDDVILLDDNPNKADSRLSESEIFVVKPRIVSNTTLTLPQSENLPNSSTTSSRNNTSSHLPQTNTSVHQNMNKSSGKMCENSSLDLKQNSRPPRKKSKLAYHRPAHLVTPLTQPSPAIPSTKIDSVSNIYNPNADSSEKQTGLRPIVIDGNNVAISHGKGTFSLKGIQICINFFEKRGHRQIKVFIPQYRMNRDNHDELQKMERNGLVVLTPSRKVNGKVVASYDDRYIVQYAAEFGGVIVSTDNYRDLLIENPSWRDTIETRLLMFTWVDDLLMFPQDPLGRRGPSLDDFLKFPGT